MRNDIYKHLEKHASEYVPFFTPAASNESIDAGPSPTTWSEYLECTLREGRWIDGISLKAASKRFGVQIIVVPLEGEAKDEPMSFGETRSSREPIVLILNDQQGHYTLAQLKEGRQWPKEWIQAPLASVDNPAFRGGGKACSVDTRHSWRTAATPQVSRAKSAQSHTSQWRPTSTPKTVKGKSKTLTAKEPSRHAWRCVATPSATAKSDRRHDPASSRPALTRADPEAGSGAVKAGLSEQFVWTCNLCKQVLRYTNKRSLSCARRRHVQKAHPKKKKLVAPCFPRRNTCLDPIAEASEHLPCDQRVWSCPKCHKGLPSMKQHLLKKSRDKHIMQCYGYTKAKFRKLRYRNPAWIQTNLEVNRDNAAKTKQKTEDALIAYNERTATRSFRIPPAFTRAQQSYFGCGICTQIFQRFANLRKHKCPGQKGRAAILANPGRKRMWMVCRRENNAEKIAFYIHSWQITRTELSIIEKPPRDRKDQPLQPCQWIRDLCQDGDVEPNPGPGDPGPMMTGLMINAGGQDNTWSCARWIAQDQPAFAIIQEHCMLPDKCADLANFMTQHGYRSWFAALPPIQRLWGHQYTIGGVACFVRKDKGARLVQRHVANDGQALLLQLDHAYLAGAYLPPRGTPADDSLAILDEWVASCSHNEPIFVCGDFNQEPDFADRWTALADRGACQIVRQEDGTPAPTRWEGRRAIDWMWASHPHMIQTVEFSHTVIADHKALCFTLNYCQAKVQCFKHVPTRNLTKPETVPPDRWAAALEAAWQNAECPAESSTQQEWIEFCGNIEETFNEAVQQCELTSAKTHSKAGRPKGSALQVRPVEATTFRLKQHASCRELKARKLWGRVREANLRLAHHGTIPAVLLHRIWNHPLVRNQDFQSLHEIEQWAEHEVQEVVRQDRLTKIQTWRQNMRTDMAKARRWISKQNNLPVTSVHDPNHKNNTATASNHESLEAIHSFWNTIWNRQMPPVSEAFEAWQQHTPSRPEFPWTPLSGKELHANALRQQGSAAGPDGLSGSEISQLPLKAWEHLAILLARWTDRQEVPSVWQSTRQVHLQKPDAKLRPADGAIHAKDLRPISIQCTIWRIIASTWTRRRSTRNWISSWVHPTACGGVQGSGVAKAVDLLFQKFEKGGILLSLDFQKCFDTINPALGLQCLRHFGCPQQMLRMLQEVWQQERWLTYNGEYLQAPVTVTSSLPQGDATSPLTMLALMTGLTNLVLAQDNTACTLETFLDDRNMIASNPKQAYHLWQIWKSKSQQVGLWENDNKTKVVPRRAVYRQQLINEGFSDRHVTTAARVLGIDFTARLGDSNRATQAERIKGALARLNRVAMMPINMRMKAIHAVSIVIPKAAWGAWTSLVPVRALNGTVKRLAGTGHNQASQDLFYLLAGHGLHPEFCTAMQAYSFLATEVRRRARPWPQRTIRGTWLYTVTSWLQSLGWDEVGAFHWRHSDIQVDIQWSHPLSPAEGEKEKHHIRETWRRLLFDQFLASSRRDSQAVGNPAYDEAWITRARKLFQDADTHGRAVMVGAVVSDARYDRMKRREIAHCQWCRDPDAIPGWVHHAWECPAFAQGRPLTPDNAFQKILGWPVGQSAVDRSVLDHLALVRSRVLDQRYRGTGL